MIVTEETAAEIERLTIPEGRTGLSPEQVRASQERRLYLALALAARNEGYEVASVEKIAAYALVSKTTLYQLFGSKEGVLRGAVEEFVGGLAPAIEAASEEGHGWPDRLRGGLEAVLDRVAAEPELARLAFVEDRSLAGLNAGETALEALLGTLFDSIAVDGGAAGTGAGLIRRLAIGGVCAPIADRLAAGRDADVGDLLPSLQYFVITAYAGPDRALEFVT